MTGQRGASIELCKAVWIETTVVCHGILKMARAGFAHGKRKRDGIPYHSCKESAILLYKGLVSFEQAVCSRHETTSVGGDGKQDKDDCKSWLTS
jgi:hypothetical protein